MAARHTIRSFQSTHSDWNCRIPTVVVYRCSALLFFQGFFKNLGRWQGWHPGCARSAWTGSIRKAEVFFKDKFAKRFNGTDCLKLSFRLVSLHKQLQRPGFFDGVTNYWPDAANQERSKVMGSEAAVPADRIGWYNIIGDLGAKCDFRAGRWDLIILTLYRPWKWILMPLVTKLTGATRGYPSCPTSAVLTIKAK